MAGYALYSLDWEKFQRFVNSPTREQLLAFSEIISDGLDEYDEELEEGDPVADWPSEPEMLCDLVKQRLTMPDWYGDLSDTGKRIWEWAVFGFCMNTNDKEMGFEVESDGIYWDVIELAQKHHKLPQNYITDHLLTHFGHRLYRYHPDPEKRLAFDGWVPYHSMHTPEEVQQMIEALNVARPTIEASGDEDALRDYEEELMPALDKIADRGRMLFIQLDT